MNIDRINFIETLESVKDTGYIYQDEHGKFQKSDKNNDKCLKLVDIAEQAKKILCYSLQELSAKQNYLESYELSIRYEKALKNLNGRVTASVSKNWWFCIYRIFCCFFEFVTPLDAPIAICEGSIKNYESIRAAELKTLAEKLEKEPEPQYDTRAQEFLNIEVQEKADIAYAHLHGLSERQENRHIIKKHREVRALYEIVEALRLKKTISEFRQSDFLSEFLAPFSFGFNKPNVFTGKTNVDDVRIELRGQLEQILKEHPNIDSLAIKGAKHFACLPEEISLIKGLKSLTIEKCPNFRILVEVKVPQLEKITISDCDLRVFPDLKGFPNLDTVLIENCGMSLFPTTPSLPNSVTVLSLSGNNISFLPQWISNAKKLRLLGLQHTKIQGFPKTFYQGLESLEKLCLKQTLLVNLPVYIALMPSLREVVIDEHVNFSNVRAFNPNIQFISY